MPKTLPPMRALERSLPLKLLMAREAVMARFRPHLAARGLTEQQWRVVRALAEGHEIDISTLAERTCLLLPSLSRIIPDLVRRGLVARRRVPGRRRSSLVALTRDGRALFDDMARGSETIYGEIETALGAAGCADIIGQLDRLIRALAPKASVAATQTQQEKV